MSIADELRKLQELRADGVLSEEEFQRAKEATLSGSAPPGPPPKEDNSIGRAANRYVTFHVVWAIIGLILFLFFLFGIFLPRWNSFPGP